jgi:hypothetical protein
MLSTKKWVVSMASRFMLLGDVIPNSVSAWTTMPGATQAAQVFELLQRAPVSLHELPAQQG